MLVIIVIIATYGVVEAMVWLVILLNMILIIILDCFGYGVRLFCGYAQFFRALP